MCWIKICRIQVISIIKVNATANSRHHTSQRKFHSRTRNCPAFWPNWSNHRVVQDRTHRWLALASGHNQLRPCPGTLHFLLWLRPWRCRVCTVLVLILFTDLTTGVVVLNCTYVESYWVCWCFLWYSWVILGGSGSTFHWFLSFLGLFCSIMLLSY